MQADAVGELPPGVRPRVRPRADGIRRAVLGLLPVRGADLVHGLDIDLPLGTRAATVSTVHDLSVFDTPEAHPRLRARGEQLLVRRALARADALIAVSAFTAERVAQLSGRSCTVVPLAPGAGMWPADAEEQDRLRRFYRLPETFVLHVGTVEPRKDLPLLATAVEAAGAPLVLAGGVAAGQRVPTGARHLGHVPADHLPGLYAAATVVAYCSRYEGFGLPPLEAMACGGVVLASRVGALPETLGRAARLVPPRDEAALRTALTELLADPAMRHELRLAGLRQAAGFTWQRSAQQTLAVYREVGLRC